MDFAGRYGPWALIAGASEGTGRAFARQIAAQGVPSILVARRAEPLDDLAEQIRAESGVECVTATVDLSAADAFAQIRTASGDREVGLFVSNAGSDTHGAHFLDRDFQLWQDQIQRNVTTMAACAHHFGRGMRARRRGGLLLVNSGACYGGSSYMATYAATKAYTLCFAEGLWAELNPHGVDVLTLVMGMTDTPALRTLLEEKGQPVPAGIASAEDVAALGLERLPHGPIHNWGVAANEGMYGAFSADARRERIETIDRSTRRVFEQA